jgi:membrane fusion protein (multidrug efflux system)
MIRCFIALLCLVLSVGPAFAQSQIFEGRIEAVEQGILASSLDGRIVKIRFDGGETVTAGQALIELDKADFGFAVSIAEAELAEAKALSLAAEAVAARAATLSNRGVGTEAQRHRSKTALTAAEAAEKAAEIRLQQAKLDFERTTIRAPISGIIGRPGAAVGQYIEAKAGLTLATIIQIDPVLVAYEVPYVDRMALLADVGSDSIEALFERISLTLYIVDSQTYSHSSRPAFASASVSPETGMLTVWGRFDNPNIALRPGMPVQVQSTLVDPAATGE